MARSRSSFELSHALAAATTLAREEKKPGEPVTDPVQFRGVALVSFQPAEPPPPPAPAPLPPTPVVPIPVTPAARTTPVVPPPTSEDDWLFDSPPQPETARPHAIPPPPPEAITAAPSDDEKARPPRLPDLSSVVSPIVRCEKVIEWIAQATSGAGVFIADADGLPVAGDIQDAEARIGASGLVAASIATLLQALPGQPAPLFEVHIGDGPYFHLIGFHAAKGTYVVGLTRHEPLSPRQAHAVRLACRHAFGEPLSSVVPGSRL